jgi:hypothetical protein
MGVLYHLRYPLALDELYEHAVRDSCRSSPCCEVVNAVVFKVERTIGKCPARAPQKRRAPGLGTLSEEFGFVRG